MRIEILLMLVAIIPAQNSSAQIKKSSTMNDSVAAAIFSAWQKGEAGKGYGDFRQYLNEGVFKYFSHPLSAVYKGREGFTKLAELIKGREAKPNNLIFSNIIRYKNGNSVCFQFDSEGKVAGGFDYKGYNIIQLEIEHKNLVGFREYFGFIDPAWFK